MIDSGLTRDRASLASRPSHGQRFGTPTPQSPSSSSPPSSQAYSHSHYSATMQQSIHSARPTCHSDGINLRCWGMNYQTRPMRQRLMSIDAQVVLVTWLVSGGTARDAIKRSRASALTTASTHAGGRGLEAAIDPGPGVVTSRLDFCS